MSVERQGNRLIFPEKVDWAAFRSFNSKINELPSGHLDHLVYDFSATSRAYPNGMVPIIAATDKRISPFGIYIEIIEPKDEGSSTHFGKSGWLHYLSPSHYRNTENTNFRYGLHRFTEDNLNDSINYILEWLLRSLTFSEGVHPSIEWMLGELSGNVADHADIDYGWMQVTLFPNKNRISAVICDTGIGIPKSMRAAFPDLATDMQALQKAIEKTVTSKPRDNQGNGIAGSIALAKAANGRLLIASGSSHLIIEQGSINPFEGGEFFSGTIIELQLDTDQPIDIMDVFSRQVVQRSSHPITFFEMMYENDKGNLAPLRLLDQASSFSNRRTGQKFRTLIENILINNKQLTVLIDFEGVNIITSSFADEVFGKLAAKLGVWGLSRRIKVENINQTCDAIIAEVVEQRITQKYGGSGS